MPLRCLLGLLIFGGLVAADRFGAFGQRPGQDVETYDAQACQVVKVVDGDTIDVDIPDRRNGHDTTRLRLWGVDTPETKKPDTPVQHFGPEAARRTRELTLGKTVRLEFEPGEQPRDRYGRLLAWVRLPDGRLLNQVLIEEGFAYADPRYNHHLKNVLREAQRSARDAGRGLWAEARSDDWPHYYREGHHELPGR